MSRPNVIDARKGPTKTPFNPVIDLSKLTPAELKRAPRFALPRSLAGVKATAATLTNLFYSDDFVANVTRLSNDYVNNRLPPLRRQVPIRESEILHFFAIVYYLGMVPMPSKYDLWATDDVLPSHSIATENGMTRDRFKYLWRNISFHEVGEGGDADGAGGDSSSDDTEEEADDELDGDANESEGGPRRARAGRSGKAEAEPEESDDEDDSDSESGAADEVPTQEELLRGNNKKWFSKTAYFIQLVRRISLALCKCPGFAMAVDEMMVRFTGRSAETFRMDNKPIGQGYKFQVLADSSTGYVYNFTPDGRRALEKRRSDKDGAQVNEYDHVDKSKILGFVLFLLSPLFNLAGEQRKKFVVTFDNYFTVPKLMSKLRERGIGVVGTARPRTGWPPEEIKMSSDATFNDLKWTVDKHGTLVLRWIDNGVVLLVSTVHNVEEDVLRPRKKPRRTKTNSKFIDVVWKDGPVRKLRIPRLIDDYNHWMGAVDVADQRIAYYAPDMRCRRTWMPMMLQCMNIIRNNSYVVYLELECEKQRTDEHKRFLMDMIRSLRLRARTAFLREQGEARRRRRGDDDDDDDNAAARRPAKRLRMSSKAPSLDPSRRSDRPRELHSAVIVKQQGACRYCAFKRLSWLRDNPNAQRSEAPKVRKPARTCGHCNVHLCKDHFNVYHGF